MTLRVLLLDDDAASTLFLRQILEEEGFDIQTALNKDEAISKSSSFKPDIILCDIMLDERTTGAETAKEIIQISPETKIIFLTGLSENQAKEYIKDTPHLTVFEKPLDFQIITDFLKKHAN